MHATLPRLAATDFPRLPRKALTTVQVNVGYRCNQQCVHCHVNAGPNRKEEMDTETVDLVIRFLAGSGVENLDITGGAPELNPHFRRLVVAARGLGVHVIDRCNLTITEQPGSGRPRRVPRREPGRGGRFAALLPRGERGPAAWQGRVRDEPPGAQETERRSATARPARAAI